MHATQETTLQTLSGHEHASPPGSGRQCSGELWAKLSELCQLLRTPISLRAEDDVLLQRLRLKSGQFAYTSGQAFENMHVVNIGFLKTVHLDESGNEHILSFPMKGDLLGVDGIPTQRHAAEVVALSDCELIAISFKQLCLLGRTHAEFESFLYDILSRELVREQEMAAVLGGLAAEARVARFLLMLGDRFASIGYSRTLFNLRMTRHEIGNYLGLTLETVSRVLSAFKAMGFIELDQRTIRIIDATALRNLRRLPPSWVNMRRSGRTASASVRACE